MIAEIECNMVSKVLNEVLLEYGLTGLNFFEDGGHGWLEVPFKLLEQLSIADKITHYSYRDDGFAYLEEDNDLSTFAAAIGCNMWTQIKDGIIHHYTEHESIIRGYNRFHT